MKEYIGELLVDNQEYYPTVYRRDGNELVIHSEIGESSFHMINWKDEDWKNLREDCPSEWWGIARQNAAYAIMKNERLQGFLGRALKKKLTYSSMDRINTLLWKYSAMEEYQPYNVLNVTN